MGLEKLKQDYLDLQGEYEELKQEYEFLENMYDELKEIEEKEGNMIGDLLQDIKSNYDLQNKIYEICKKSKNNKEAKEKIDVAIELYIDNFLFHY